MARSVAKDVFDIRDKIIVITGGLGQLGQQFAASLIERGGRVAVFDAAFRPGHEPVGLFGDAPRDQLFLVAADVTNRASLEAAVADVNAKWGTPYGLINAAALDSPPDAPAEENGPFETFPEDSWNRVLDVNLKGVFFCCQIIGRQMAAAGRGSIINIGSTYGMVSPDQRIYEYRGKDKARFCKPVAYSASKSALLNLTRYVATYWAGRNVRTNLLTLGGVYNNQDPEFLQGYCARVPLGRMAQPDEYNGAVVFLLSEASQYMTGSNLVIDGGWTAW